MKAIVYTTYGHPDVLQLREVAKPVLKDNQVPVKVHASSANALDFRRFEKASLLGRFLDGVLLKAINTVIGADIAGQVEAVGAGVTQFKPGDEVFGQSKGARGAFAEYACADENEVALKPANLSFEVAAAVPVAATTALHGLRDAGQIHSVAKVLVNGAADGVGTFAVQIAKAFGAKVTGVCSSRNLDMVRSIGADHVIDYTREDFTRSDKTYDVILDVIGKSSFSLCWLLLISSKKPTNFPLQFPLF